MAVQAAQLIVQTAMTPDATAGLDALIAKLREAQGASEGSQATVAGGASTSTTSLLGAARAAQGMGLALAAAGVPLGPLSTGIGAMTLALRGASDMADGLGQKLVMAGGVITGISAALLGFAHNETEAAGKLRNDIKNTGQDISDYGDQISKAKQQGEEFGFTHAKVDDALARLTEGLHDPQKALNDLGLAEDYAKHQGVDLAQAATDLVRIHEGYGRGLKALGVDITFTHNAEANLESARKALANSTDAATKAQQRYDDAVQAAKDLAQRQADGVDRVAAAEQALADARARLTEVTIQQNEAHQITVVDEDRLQQAAQRVADANDKVTEAQRKRAEQDYSVLDAEQALMDLEADAQKSGQLTLAQQEAIEHAALAVQRAKEQQSSQGDTSSKDAATGLRDALAAQKQLQDELALKTATTTQQQYELSKAQEDVQKATDAATQAQKQQADQALVTDAANRRVAEALSSLQIAQQKQKDAQGKVDTATQAKTAEDNQGDRALEQMQTYLKGTAQSVADTTGGMLDHLKAKIEDVLSSLGQNVGKYGVIIGPALAGIGALFQMHLGDKIGKAVIDVKSALATMGPESEEVEGAIGGLTGVGEGAEAAGAAAEVGGAEMEAGWLLGLGPIALIIAGVAAVAFIAYEVITHWGTVKKWLGEFWDWFKGIIGDVWDWLKTNVPKLVMDFVDILTGAWIIIEIVKHWDGIKTGLWDAIKGIGGFGKTILEDLAGPFLHPDVVWNAFKGLVDMIWGWGQRMYDDAIKMGGNLLAGLWNGISGAAGWLWDKIKGWASGVIDGIKGFFGIGSPSKVFEEMGRWNMQGMANGIMSGGTEATNAMVRVGKDMVNASQGSLTPSISTAGLAGQALRGGPPTNQGATTINHFHIAGQVVTMENLTDQVQANMVRRGRNAGGALIGGLT